MAGDTIYALSSAPGKAGVCVVRVSGPAAFASFKMLAGIKGDILPRHAYYKKLVCPKNDRLIDEALAVAFQGPFSFTGEDVVEYHLHGSPAVLDDMLSCLSTFAGHRPADHGEYTRRAFENGKLDLTEAEAVADLINAETQAQKDQALMQMGGALSKLYEGWRERLIRVMAYIEAVIDFPDEDVPDEQVLTQRPELEKLLSELRAHLNDKRKGERLREGIHVVILGAPNAGKSSLLNALAQRDIAIVSPMAGTTRDIIEAHLNIGGYPVIVADTAGLREISDSDGGHGDIEGEGIRRALARAEAADITIRLYDGTQKQNLKTPDENTIVVFNKSDEAGFQKADGSIPLSVKTGDGMKDLLDALENRIKTLYHTSRDTPSLTRTRHRANVEECAKCLEAALQATAPELMAEDVRMAARALGRITGRVDVEDLLDVIFRDFCIGK